MDEQLRRLERLALTGDEDARDKLLTAYDRMGQPYPEHLIQALETRKKWKLDPEHGQPEVWRQIGGDVSASDYGCVLGRIVNDYVEIWRIENVVELVGEKEAKEVGAPFWTSEIEFELDELPDLPAEEFLFSSVQEKILSSMKSYNLSNETWNDLDFFSRAEVITSNYGYGDSDAVWGESVLPVPAEQIIWWAGPQTTAEWEACDSDFRHNIMQECFTCPQCGVRSSVATFSYEPGPPEIELSCGCRIDSNQPEITCSACLRMLGS